jgi:Mg2+ and Co2+ transporter CorA
LKRRAASQGFADVYDLLRYKRDRIQDSLKNLVSSRAEVSLLQALRKDLKEIERLLAADLESVVRGVEELGEVARVDKGGLAELREEMAGLMREIR